MNEMDQNLIRKLNPRERRRLNVYQMLPVDAIDLTYSARTSAQCHETKLLYRYGCGLTEMDLQIDDFDNGIERRNLISRLRGFYHLFRIIVFLTHVTRFAFIIFHLERIRNRKRRSMLSIAESFDEPSFILEPIFVVCVKCE